MEKEDEGVKELGPDGLATAGDRRRPVGRPSSAGESSHLAPIMESFPIDAPGATTVWIRARSTLGQARPANLVRLRPLHPQPLSSREEEDGYSEEIVKKSKKRAGKKKTAKSNEPGQSSGEKETARQAPRPVVTAPLPNDGQVQSGPRPMPEREKGDGPSSGCDHEVENYDALGDDIIGDDYDASRRIWKFSKWLIGFFTALNKLSVEEINAQTRLWTCPACRYRNRPGPVVEYEGLQSLIAHAKTQASVGVKRHRTLAACLEEVSVVKVSWAEVAAELPQLVEEIHRVERTRDRVENTGRIYKSEAHEKAVENVLHNIYFNDCHYENILDNRATQEKALDELWKVIPRPRDDDNPKDDKDYDGARLLKGEEADRLIMRMHRHGWKSGFGLNYGSYEDTTPFGPMGYTYGKIPSDACCEDVLEIFSVKVTELKDGIEWPLHVYGHIAARDSKDENRNILFSHERNNCQILTTEDPYLLLTGPSRAVVIPDRVTFEVDLRVKGKTESEDKVLCMKVFCQRRNDSSERDCHSKRCTLKFSFGLVKKAVEATIDVKSVFGFWPYDFGALFSCRVTNSRSCVTLLDSLDGKVPATFDGSRIELSRRVVGVELDKKLLVSVEAVGGSFGTKCRAKFRAKKAGLSRSIVNIGSFCKLEITVGWSLFAIAVDQRDHMRRVIMNRLCKHTPRRNAHAQKEAGKQVNPTEEEKQENHNEEAKGTRKASPAHYAQRWSQVSANLGSGPP